MIDNKLPPGSKLPPAATAPAKKPRIELVKLPEVAEADKWILKPGDTLWAYAKKIAGPDADDEEVMKALAGIYERQPEYAAENRKRPDGVVLVFPGEEILKPKAAAPPKPPPPPPLTPEQAKAEAEAQVAAAKRAAAEEENKYKNALSDFTSNVKKVPDDAPNIAQVLGAVRNQLRYTDSKYPNTLAQADDAKYLRSRLPDGDPQKVAPKAVGESPAGKTPVGVNDSVVKSDVARSTNELAKEVAAAKNGRNAPLTEDEKAKFAERAAPLLAKAKELGFTSESTQALQAIVNDVATTAVTRGTEALAKEAIDTQNKQRGPLTDAQQQDLATRAAPQLAKAKELGVSTDATKRLQAIVNDAATTAVTRGTEALAKEAIDTQNKQRGPLSATQQRELAARAAPLLQQAKELGVSNEATERLQGIVDDVAVMPSLNQAFRQSELREQYAAEPSANEKFRQGELREQYAAEPARRATASTNSLAQEVIAVQNSQRGPLTDGQKQDLGARALPLLAEAKKAGVSTEATKRLQGIVDDNAKAQLANALDRFDKSGPPVPQRWSEDRLTEGAKLLELLKKEAPELLQKPAAQLIARALESARANAVAKPADA